MKILYSLKNLVNYTQLERVCVYGALFLSHSMATPFLPSSLGHTRPPDQAFEECLLAPPSPAAKRQRRVQIKPSKKRAWDGDGNDQSPSHWSPSHWSTPSVESLTRTFKSQRLYAPHPSLADLRELRVAFFTKLFRLSI